jgi:hypothetical protein
MDNLPLISPADDTQIQAKIHTIRGQRVMLDMDLATLYGVETRVLNQAVKRNPDRFPVDFVFQLNEQEWISLRSQFVILEKGRGKHSKFLPSVFTEHGVTMLSSVLKSKIAILMNIAIVRAFVAIRRLTNEHRVILEQIADLKDRVGSHDQQLSSIYEAIENLLDEKTDHQSWANRERIGFHTRSPME